MKFIKFNEWLKRLDEESAEERRKRELEAERRAQEFDKHMDYVKNIEKSAPKEIKRGSPEWMSYMSKYDTSETPSDKFREEVYDIIYKKTGFDIMYRPMESQKEQSDLERILQLIEDCYDDGTSVQETVEMTTSLLKSMGYIK